MLVHGRDNPLRLGVLISGGGRTLMNLHALCQAGELPARVVVVVASRPCKGIERAQAAGLNVHLVPYKKMPDVEPAAVSAPASSEPALFETYSSRITALLDQSGVDLVIMAGFLSLWIIPPAYLGRVINIHPALLPSFGGQGMYGHHVHEAVLRHGCKVSGCTVHFVTNQYDRGPIILQRCVTVLEGDTPDTLADRVFQQECIAFPEAVSLFAAGRLRIDGGVVRIAERP